MAEEVKIVDVAGGPASEATLQELLKVMKGGGSGGGSAGSTKAAAKANDLYTTAVTRGTTVRKKNTKAVKDATSATEKFSNAVGSAFSGIGSVLGGTIGIIKNFTGAMASATTIGGVVEAIPIFGSVLGQATGYFDKSLSSFQQLSQVGAGFGNDMMAMRNASAQAGLSLEQFASAIGNNSERLRFLGGTSSEGAARFGRLSKALRTQEAGLMRLGFTQEEVNEGLMDYIEGQALSGNLRGRSDRSLAAGAEKYMKELDLLSKVTGKSRKELQDEANARNQAANINVLAARLSGDALDNFNNNMGFAANIMNEDFANAMGDMADGVSQTPLAQFLESNVAGLKELQEQNASGSISQQEYQTRLMAMLPQIHQLSDRMGAAGVSAMLGAEGAAEFANMTARSRQAGQTYIAMQEQGAAAERAREEQARRAPLTETFANFAQTIQNVRSSFETALIDSGILDTVGTLMGDLGTGMTSLATGGVKDLQDYLGSEGFKADMAAFQEWIQKTKDKLAVFLGDVKEKGLMETIKGMFGTEGEDSSFGDMIGEWISDAIGAMLPSADTVLIGLAAGIATLIFAPFLGAFGAIGVAIAAMFGWDTIKGWAVDAWNAITGIFTGIKDWWNTLDFMKPINDAWTTIKGFFGFGDTNFSISQLADDAWNTVTGWFGFGDTNFSISQMATDAWNTVTGWFGLDGTSFSISQMATDAWNTVTGWFSFGETNFSISQMATDMWNTVTGWFTFGEGESGFSLSGLATGAWDTVKSWFSFEGMEMPSISSLFQGIIDTVKGFFSFDFELPDFTDYLPKWLGGKGKSLFGGDEPGTTATASVSSTEPMPDVSTPGNVSTLSTLDYGYQLEQAKLLKTELADIGSMQTFNNELERMQAGLDNSAVEAYNTSMQKLVDTLEELNDVLAEDNKGTFGGGTGVSAASMLSSGQSGGGSGTGGQEQLERLNMLVSQLISLQTEGNRNTRQTVAAISNNLQAGIG